MPDQMRGGYEMDRRLDEWVAAKRKKDFATADRLREELRRAGVDPDKARPRDLADSDRMAGYGGRGGWGGGGGGGGGWGS